MACVQTNNPSHGKHKNAVISQCHDLWIPKPNQLIFASKFRMAQMD